MHPEWLIVSAIELVIAGPSVDEATRWPTIHPTECRVFHAVNGLPNALYPVLWLPMQLGNLVVGTAAGLVAGFIARDLAVVIGVLVATVLKLVTERVLRKEMAGYLSVRSVRGRARSEPSCGDGMCRAPARASLRDT